MALIASRHRARHRARLVAAGLSASDGVGARGCATGYVTVIFARLASRLRSI